MYCTGCGKQFEGRRIYCLDCGTRLERSISFSAFRAAKTTKRGAILGGRYELRGLLGQGASSRVYVAEDVKEKRPVAVKLFTASTLGGKARFLGEARALMAISHPNVIKVYEVGEQAGSPFFVLELLRGESLGDYLRREGKVPQELALNLARQAASGLAAAHEAGIVHRDVKPDNLYLIGEPGEPYGLKVIDFGLARAATSNAHKSGAGVVIGTVTYMAPEQILSEPIDARSDVYGLGAVLFRALTGELLFGSHADLDVLAQQLYEPARSIAKIDKSLSGRVERVVATALRKHPANRYPTMAAMRDDLMRLVGLEAGEPRGVARTVTPDIYVPMGTVARASAEALRTHHESMIGPKK